MENFLVIWYLFYNQYINFAMDMIAICSTNSNILN